MADLSGQSIGRYHLLEQLGEGGMATVYKAYDTRLEREVAIKIIRSGVFGADILKDILKRFEREAKALAKLSHPNIVKVHDFGEYKRTPFLVMEYLPGGTLKKMLGKPLPWREAVKLLLPIVRGVAYAHQRGILHRDIKPANILITETGEPMLSDFGIAKLFEAEQTTALTASGMAIGTPEYMAPEQWTGQAGPPADLYALGIVLYEMVAGRKPYIADTPAAILLKQASEPLPSPRKFTPDLPESLEYLLLKALAKDPDNRFPDASALAEALENLLDGKAAPQPEAKPETIAPPPPLPVQETETIPALPTPQETVVPLQDGGKTVLPETTKVDRTPMPAPADVTRDFPPVAPRPQRHLLRFAGIGLVIILALAGLAWMWEKVTPNIPASILPTSTVTVTSEATVISLAPTNTPAPTLPTETLAPTITPTATSLPTEIADAKGVSMRLVPAGAFTMGSDTGKDDEKPAHLVTLDAFYIDVYEVTNSLYSACVSARICEKPIRNSSLSLPYYYNSSHYGNFPVVYVNWNSAKTYCEWRGARLPTEAEWEKAARGIDARIYPWGNDMDCKKGDFNDDAYIYKNQWVTGSPNCDGYLDTAPVGFFPNGASPYGILDMAGNVSEWVNDWYQPNYYAAVGSNASNPLGPTNGEYRVIRGSSYYWGSFSDAIFKRGYRNPSESLLYDTGFRCAVSAEATFSQPAVTPTPAK